MTCVFVNFDDTCHAVVVVLSQPLLLLCPLSLVVGGSGLIPSWLVLAVVVVHVTAVPPRISRREQLLSVYNCHNCSAFLPSLRPQI